LVKYNGYEQNLVLPDTFNGKPVKIIETGFLSGNSSVRQLTVPNSVEVIKNGAFSNSSLTNVALGKGVRYVGERAFYCPNLTAITVSEENQHFTAENGVLYSKDTYPNGLTEKHFVVPNGVKAIKEHAFYYNNNIEKVTLPEGMTRVDTYAFDFCFNLKEAVLPSTLKYIGSFAFCETSLESIVIPDGVTRIEEMAFGNCRKLKSVQFPKNLKYIGYGAFCNCALTEISLPEGVEEIATIAFSGCKDLSRISLPNSLVKVHVDVFAGTAYMNARKNNSAVVENGILLACNNSVIPSGVRVIAGGVFKYKTVNSIPEGVTHICHAAFQGAQLLNATLPKSLVYIGIAAFSDSNAYFPSIPNGIKEIETLAFENTPWMSAQTGEFIIVGDAFLFDIKAARPRLIFRMA